MLLRRIDHEWSSRNRIFDLPTARIWSPEPDVDLGFEFLGRRCATPSPLGAEVLARPPVDGVAGGRKRLTLGMYMKVCSPLKGSSARRALESKPE